MKYFKIAALGLIVACLGLLSVVEVRHRLTYGHFIGYGWHVDVWEQKINWSRQNTEIVYHASLTDFTIHSLTFEATEFDPGLDFGLHFPYKRGYNELVQRWDRKTGTWATVYEDIRSQPHAHPNARIRVWPLGRISGRIWGIKSWDGVKEGDTLRIVFLASFKPEDVPGQHAFYSAPFVARD
jgi:hypothetical protein